MINGERVDLRNSILCLREICAEQARRIIGKKIAIPSDLSVHLQALSVNVRNSCESLSPKPKGFRRVTPLRVSATTLKFQVFASEPCGTLTSA